MSAKTDDRTAGRSWAYAGVIVGALVSTAANVAHSYVPPKVAPAWWPTGKPWNVSQWHPQTGSVLGAVFWPIALFLVSEILVRPKWPSGWQWIAVRYVGLLPVAAVAAIVSYKHLSALITYYGEDPLTAHIGPLAVDGLMVMATGALVAIAGHARGHESDADPDTGADVVNNTRPDTADTNTDSTPDTQTDSKPRPMSAAPRTPKRTPKRTGTPDTGAAVAKLREAHPDWTAGQIADRLKISDRTVRRHLQNTNETPEPAVVEHANGHEFALTGAEGE